MDYLTFVERVLQAAATLVADDYNARQHGVDVREVAQSLELSVEGDFWGSQQRLALLRAVDDLDDLGLASVSDDFTRIVVTERGRAAKDLPLRNSWRQIFDALRLDDEEKALMGAVIARSEQQGDGYAAMAEVTLEDAFGDLGWPADTSRLVSVGGALRGKTCLRGLAAQFPLRPTYIGVVLATREAETSDQRLLEQLLADWETTTIEFKRELPLRTATQKEEFVRDTLALATTQGQQDRYLIVGFDPKTRAPFGSVDPALRQDQIEDLLTGHVVGQPPGVRYRRVPWASINAGLIEIRRDATVVPYRGAASIRERFGAEVFIRRLSHVAVATPEDIAALEAESAEARARAARS
jgi:hypothetical protein